MFEIYLKIKHKAPFSQNLLSNTFLRTYLDNIRLFYFKCLKKWEKEIKS